MKLSLRSLIAALAFCAIVGLAAATLEAPIGAGGNQEATYCPNNCSYPQGTCDPNLGCICATGFAAPDCSVTIVPINNRQTVTATLQPGTWAVYSFAVTDDHIQLMVLATRTSAQGDPDLYLRFASAPDRTHYDYADFSTGQLNQVSITRSAGQLQSGTYYIGVYAYGSSAATYSLEVRAMACPNDCNSAAGHGTCNTASHTCTCADGWVMTDCSASNRPLAAPEDTVGDSLDPMEWMYFEIDITQQQMYNDIDFFALVNKTSDATAFGYIDLYAAFNRFPNPTDWDYRANLNQQTNSFKVCSSSLLAGTWRIGVMNYGFAEQNFTLTTRLIATCPNQCSGHGACNLLTGACACTPGWGGADCSYDIEGGRAGYTTVGTAVGLSFFFIILGAAPFVIYLLFGQRIRSWWASRGSSAGLPVSDYPATVTPAAGSGSVQTGSYQTF